MDCPKCGAPLNDGAKFCGSCGYKMEDVQGTAGAEVGAPGVQTAEDGPTLGGSPAPKSGLDFKKMGLDPIGLAVGTLLIIVGIMRITSANVSISTTSFGGDFYTYTYRGIVKIVESLKEIQVSLGWIVIAIGAAIDVRALRR